MAEPAAPSTPLDARLEREVAAIAAELRCLVCQNQSVADSSADLAVDLRRQVRELLQRGQNREQILKFMTARYGDFVLYRPPVQANTALLWAGPAVLLGAGLVGLAWALRRRARASADQFDPDPDLDPDPNEDEAKASPLASGERP